MNQDLPKISDYFKVLKKRLRLLLIFTVFLGVVIISFILVKPRVPLEPMPAITANEIEVLIREGLNVKQIGETLQQAGLFFFGGAEEFVKYAQKHEGYLFPDTYRFFKDSVPKTIVSKMKKNFESKVIPAIEETLKQQNNKQLSQKDLFDTIILASLLEKEVNNDKDKRLVAGTESLKKRYVSGKR